MAFCLDAMHALGAALLPVAAALLFEELTLGGLVRLILAPPPRRAKQMEPKHSEPESNRPKLEGESRCSH